MRGGLAGATLPAPTQGGTAMNRPILVAYASRHGSTKEVAYAVADALLEHGLDVQVRDAGAVQDVADYGGAVLGGSLYAGRWHPHARRFLRRHAAALADRPLAVFALGPRTTADEDVAGSRAQLDRALAKA